jgi:BASS family bile acid:Na+ symporter
MSLAALIGVTIKISIALTVFGLGLRTTREEALSVFRTPGLLLRSLVSMNIIMPVLAVTLALVFDLQPSVKLALIALAVSPVPPILPGKQLKFGGDPAYTFGLLVATCALAVILIPLSIAILSRVFGRSYDVPASAIAVTVLSTVLAPLAAGILIKRWAPGVAARLAKPVSVIAPILLVVAILAVLFAAFPTVRSLIGDGTLAAMCVFVVVGLVSGHLLGGPDPGNRTVLALASATRHPGVAIAIAHAAHPELKAATAAVLLYCLLSVIVSKPYLSWWSGRQSGRLDIPSPKARHA